MFLTDCPTCGLRELRGARAIETVVSTDRGHAIVYRCHRCEAVNVLGGNPSADARLDSLVLPGRIDVSVACHA